MPPDDPARLRLRLLDDILHLPEHQLGEVQRLLADLRRPAGEPTGLPAPAVPLDWPHAPLHRLGNRGEVGGIEDIAIQIDEDALRGLASRTHLVENALRIDGDIGRGIRFIVIRANVVGAQQ